MIGSIFIEVLLTRWERSLCFGLNLYSLIRMGTAKHDQTKCLKQTWNETEIEHKQRLKSQSKKWRCQMNKARAKNGVVRWTELIATTNLIIVLRRGVPGEPLFVKLDDRLRAFHIRLSRRNKIGLVRSLPFDEEHQFPRRVGGANDPFGIQVPVESSWTIVIGLPLLLGLVRPRRSRWCLFLACFLLMLLLLPFLLLVYLCWHLPRINSYHIHR